MDKIHKLKKCVKSITVDAEKFFLRNNTSAGVRVRKKLQDCKKIAQDIRKLVQNVKFNFTQKKAKIKAARAAYLGEHILDSQNFRLKCLKETHNTVIKIKDLDNFYSRGKTESPEFKPRISNIYDLEYRINSKTIAPIPTSSNLNYTTLSSEPTWNRP
jgi:hypothetical protein